jgi:hypothetical protein
MRLIGVNFQRNEKKIPKSLMGVKKIKGGNIWTKRRF